MSTGDLRRHVREPVRKINPLRRLPRQDSARRREEEKKEGAKSKETIRYLRARFSIREGIPVVRDSRSAMSLDENFRARSQRGDNQPVKIYRTQSKIVRYEKFKKKVISWTSLLIEGNDDFFYEYVFTFAIRETNLTSRFLSLSPALSNSPKLAYGCELSTARG